MKNASSEIDKYFAAQPEFQRGMCEHLRELVHQAVPEIVEEWKWGPSFNCEGLMVNIAAFKKHVALVFHNGAAMTDRYQLFTHGKHNNNVRIIQFKESDKWDDKKIIYYLKEAASVNKKGIKPIRNKRVFETPPEFLKLLKKHKVEKNYQAMPSSHQWEYVEWITTAKKEETKISRMEKAVEMIAKNIGKNDKYRKST